LVPLSWIQVQQPTSENGSLTGVTEKEMNGTEMHIKSATGGEMVKSMVKCAYDRGFYEWLCVMITLRIKQ
jgi:hypothetical protein